MKIWFIVKAANQNLLLFNCKSAKEENKRKKNKQTKN